MDDVRSKSPQERIDYFQQKLAELIKKTDVEPIPTILRQISADVSTITLIDLQNEEMLKRYDRTLIKKADAEEPPQNPLAN